MLSIVDWLLAEIEASRDLSSPCSESELQTTCTLGSAERPEKKILRNSSFQKASYQGHSRSPEGIKKIYLNLKLEISNSPKLFSSLIQ